ncbi:MAG: twin-arginine translocation pathway signal [Proteobacteria bacterium]|nr:twin-arginine translocation pathway signal [Pseudomonadota bacterium]
MNAMLASTRRLWLALAASIAAALAGCAGMPSADDHPAIVFMHGNGDTAALWTTTIWRFESNGWPRDRLFAVDAPYPLARDDDAVPQAGRSSSAENAQALAAVVDRALAATGTRRVVLIANSRGGNAVRDYIAHGGGAAKVSRAILCGTPNHGVWADPGRAPGNEFNGAGAFLTALNMPQDAAGNEVTPGVQWMTIRSDGYDKYAQPDGVWIGAKGTPTHVTAEGPALRGAENIVIPGIDHRETAFSPQAFAASYRFITGHAPSTTGVTPEAHVVLNGKVSGYGVDNRDGAAPSNLPLQGAHFALYAVDPASGARRGPALLDKTIGADGLWGPFDADPNATYEFVIAAPGYATTHFYRSAFPRSSNVVHLRAERFATTDREPQAVVVLSRPRGYFGVPRDRIKLADQSPPPGIPTGVPGVSTAKLRLDAVDRPVVAEFNGERIVARTWPAAHDELTLIELTY